MVDVRTSDHTTSASGGGSGRFVLGQDAIPVEVLRNLQMAVIVGRLQEDIVRSGRMSREELDLYAWSLLEMGSTEAGVRRLRLTAHRIRPWAVRSGPFSPHSWVIELRGAESD